MFTPHRLLAALTLSALAASASAQTSQVSEIEAAPVNCATAEGDLRVLEAERDHTTKQLAKGVSAITPSGALLGVIAGTEDEKLEMLTGEYVEKIDAKIAEIKATCGL